MRIGSTKLLKGTVLSKVSSAVSCKGLKPKRLVGKRIQILDNVAERFEQTDKVVELMEYRLKLNRFFNQYTSYTTEKKI